VRLQHGGYTGPRSPNRADALIWALAELFPPWSSHQKGTRDDGEQYQLWRMAGMKPGTITNGFASLDLSYSGIVPPAERGRVLEITNLLTPSTNRRQNHAILLMQSVCEQADQANMLLLLMPQAFGTMV
jgi:hypothetical protein